MRRALFAIFIVASLGLAACGHETSSPTEPTPPPTPTAATPPPQPPAPPTSTTPATSAAWTLRQEGGLRPCASMPPISDTGATTFRWFVDVSDAGSKDIRILSAAFFSPKAGCDATTENGSSTLRLSGKSSYAPHESGETVLSFTLGDAPQTCGRAQLDASFAGGDDRLIFGIVINFGKDCPVSPPPPPGCVGLTNATLVITSPADGATVSGTQAFKARLDNATLNQYTMFWQVDGGQLNAMSDNTTNGPHKESAVDVSGWNWHGTGPYAVTFIAKDNCGNIVGQQTIHVHTPAMPPPCPAIITPNLSVWWPTDGATITGVQPFKARLEQIDLSLYNMFWQVDGGQLNTMSDNQTGGPHKEAAVDVSGWNWRGSGPYTVNFVAKDACGPVVAQKSVQIMLPVACPSGAELKLSSPERSGRNIIQNGSNASATFSISAGCNLRVTLRSYVRMTANFLPQHMLQSQTGLFSGGGPYTLTVNSLPMCGWQVDLYVGDLTAGDDLDSTNIGYYGDPVRFKDFLNGPSCQ